MPLDHRSRLSVLRAVVAEQRLFRWGTGLGPLHLWFRIAVVVYLLIRRPADGLPFIVTGAALTIADVVEATRLFAGKYKKEAPLRRSSVLFLCETAFLLAVTIHFQTLGRPWYEAAFSLLAIALLRSDLSGVISHFIFDRQEMLRRPPLASPPPPDEFTDEAIASRMRSVRRRALIAASAKAAAAIALVILPFVYFGMSPRAVVAAAAALAILSLAGTPAQMETHLGDKVPLPLRPLAEPREIASWDISRMTLPCDPVDRFRTRRVHAREVGDGIWDMVVTFMPTAAHVTRCRLFCYEQAVIRDGQPMFGAEAPALRAIALRPEPRQGLTLHLRKAFADDMPMRVVFGIAVEADGRTEMSDGVYVFTYRGAAWPGSSPRRAAIVVVDETYVSDLLEKYGDEVLGRYNAAAPLSEEDLASFVELCARNPQLPEFALARENVLALREILRVHRSITLQDG